MTRTTPTTTGDFSEAQREELLRLVRGLRDATHSVVALDAPLEELRALAEKAEALAAGLAPFSGKRPFPPFSSHPTDLPFSPVTGTFNPVSPQIEIDVVEREGVKRVLARARFSRIHEGPPTYVHGGAISAVFDQLLACANRVHGVGGLTASLTVRYRKPTPLETEVVFEAWTDRIEEEKVYTRGECRVNGELLTECEGLFIRMNAERAQRVFGKGA